MADMGYHTQLLSFFKLTTSLLTFNAYPVWISLQKMPLDNIPALNTSAITELGLEKLQTTTERIPYLTL